MLKDKLEEGSPEIIAVSISDDHIDYEAVDGDNGEYDGGDPQHHRGVNQGSHFTCND
jgi:hypothetical protein